MGKRKRKTYENLQIMYTLSNYIPYISTICLWLKHSADIVGIICNSHKAVQVPTWVIFRMFFKPLAGFWQRYFD